jgi:DNA-binding NarL/FixJ family response regulator
MDKPKGNSILDAFKTICAKSDSQVNGIIRAMYRNIIYESDTVLYNKLKELYPQLLDTKWEFEIVFLMCFGFDIDEIAFLLDLEKNTVEHKQTAIRKEFKIGKRNDIVSFFLIKVKAK